MASNTLLAGSILGLALALLYLRVGVLVAREGQAPGRAGRGFFALFWIGIAAYGILDATWALGVASDAAPLTLSVAVLHAKVVVAVAAFFGLVCYLLLVYTGRRGLVAPLAFAYGALYLVVDYYYVWRQPIGQHVGAWSAGLDYAVDGGAFQDVVTLLLFVPPALAAVAYVGLLLVVQTRESRTRLLTTAAALVVFFAAMTLGWLNGQLAWWPLAEKGLALATALAALWAVSQTRPRDESRTPQAWARG